MTYIHRLAFLSCWFWILVIVCIIWLFWLKTFVSFIYFIGLDFYLLFVLSDFLTYACYLAGEPFQFRFFVIGCFFRRIWLILIVECFCFIGFAYWLLFALFCLFSVILSTQSTWCSNDYVIASGLIDVFCYRIGGGTVFTYLLDSQHKCMQAYWSLYFYYIYYPKITFLHYFPNITFTSHLCCNTGKSISELLNAHPDFFNISFLNSCLFSTCLFYICQLTFSFMSSWIRWVA